MIVKSLRNSYRFIKALPDRVRYPRPSTTFLRLGSRYGGWWVETQGLGSHSRVISAGVGEDTTFDMALIARFHCSVVALDPTPKAVLHAQCLRYEPRFQFEQCALAATDGFITLVPPKDPTHASYTLDVAASAQSGVQSEHRFPATSLKTVLRERGWTQIDLLKLDIEGCEYEVIESIIAHKLSIEQLCVEFHPQLAPNLGKRVESAIAQLSTYGLKLVYKEHLNYTFYRERKLNDIQSGRE